MKIGTGAIVEATHRVAQLARPAVADMLERIRGSPVVHADETGQREGGANGYVWTFSDPGERYFLRRGRGKAVVDEALGESFSGVLASDFYAAYDHYPGPKQRCWAHLLRDRTGSQCALSPRCGARSVEPSGQAAVPQGQLTRRPLAGARPPAGWPPPTG